MKTKKKDYWTKEQEEAVAEYLTLDPEDPVRDRLFVKKIYKPLRIMVENIIFRYNLTTSDVHTLEQIDDCIGHVVSKFDRFDPTKGTKSYSYFGTVTKNYLIQQQMKKYKHKITTGDLERLEGFEMSNDLYTLNETELEMASMPYFVAVLADVLETELEENVDLSPNGWKLAHAIVYILRDYSAVKIHSKNMFYYLVRELTQMSTKDITRGLKELKPIYEDTRAKIIL